MFIAVKDKNISQVVIEQIQERGIKER